MRYPGIVEDISPSCPHRRKFMVWKGIQHLHGLLKPQGPELAEPGPPEPLGQTADDVHIGGGRAMGLKPQV
jgi:hypothetical protein